MDLNELRDRLRKSKPVRVTREGYLEQDEQRLRLEPRAGTREGPSRLKPHTFAQ